MSTFASRTTTTPCSQRWHIGHIQLHGGSVTERVYGDAEATAELFTGDGWLRTGDCGVFVDGKLVITGRQKDIIIVNGQNYYPHDIEEIVAQLSTVSTSTRSSSPAQRRKAGRPKSWLPSSCTGRALDDFGR